MRILNGKCRNILFFLAVTLAIMTRPAWDESSTGNTSQADGAHEKYLALRLGNVEKESNGSVSNLHGVPFIEGMLLLHPGGSAQVSVGARVERIFFLGMTDANEALGKAGQQDAGMHSGSGPKTIPAYGWADPRDYSYRF